MKKLSQFETKDKIFDLFLVFKKICEENQFCYWLAFGTLLGAVRHGDFIPWDDDFDVFMPRKDYELFIQMFKNGPLNNRYSVLHYSNNHSYPYVIARLNDNRFISVDNITKKNYGLGVSIDIYPIDGINKSDTKQIKKIKRLRYIHDLSLERKFRASKNIFKSIFKFPLWFFARLLPKHHRIKRIDALSKKYSMFEFEYCSDVCWDPRFIFSTSWFENTTQFKFRNISVSIPKDYHEFLTYVYGDYMELPPLEKRKPYHLLSVFEVDDDEKQ